jgi:Tol biopolymer transport system component
MIERSQAVLMALLLLSGCGAGDEASPQARATPAPTPTPTPPIPTAQAPARWACSDNLRITVNETDGSKHYLTSDHADFKPSWSKTGSMLTFFRALEWGGGFDTWKTRLSVIDSDGNNFRELTNGLYADFNPTWTRDGSNRILFNRYAACGADCNDIYWIDPHGSPGDEQRLSVARYEWVFSGLKDGRLFIDRIDFSLPPASRVRSFLLTPNPPYMGDYEEITRPTTQMWHKLSVSPSETKVAYMLDFDDDMGTYADVVLYWARFDLRTRTVYDPVAITLDDPRTIEEYPRWSADESAIIYDSNRSGEYQMYMYRLADGKTVRISASGSDTQFGNFENLPK